MSLDLPTPISNYFKAVNAQDADAMLSAFSDDASVRDEGQDMIGRAAIREWIDDTTRTTSSRLPARRSPGWRSPDDNR